MQETNRLMIKTVFITSVIGILAAAFVAFLYVTPAQGTRTDAPVTSEAVVQVRAGESSGSGVLVFPDVVYTAAHVVKGADKVRVTDSSGGLIDVAIVKIVEGADFAILILDKPSVVKPARYTCDLVETRSALFTIGYPLHFGKLTFNLVAAGYFKDPNGLQLLATGVALPGNSGGPVFNAKDEVVGLIQGEWNYGQQQSDGTHIFVDTDVNIVVPLSAILLVCGERTVS